MTRSDQELQRPLPRTCGNCGKRALSACAISHVAEIKHEGRLHTVEVRDLSVLKCRDCGKVFFSNDADEQIVAALRKKLGLLPPDEIRKNRDLFRLTQAELAAHLGTADETISRWENGLLIQSRAMDNLLRLYFTLPEVRRQLAAQQTAEQKTMAWS